MCLKDKIKACVYISTSIKLRLLIADMEFVLFTIFPAGNILFDSCTCSLIFVLMNELLTKYIHWHFSKFSPPLLYTDSSHLCFQLGFSASIFLSNKVGRIIISTLQWFLFTYRESPKSLLCPQSMRNQDPIASWTFFLPTFNLYDITSSI